MYKRQYQDDHCDYCKYPGDIFHYFFDCMEPTIAKSRRSCLVRIQDIYNDLNNSEHSPIGWNFQHMNPWNLATYLFPPTWIPLPIRTSILHVVIQHARKLFGYDPGYLEC